jgi:hypothetical protein
MLITNNETSWYGDCLHLRSQAGVHAETHTLDSQCQRGSAGYFKKLDDSDLNKYAVYISAPAYDDPGLDVFGYINTSSLMTREVETSRGKEAVFGMSSPEVEMVSSGKARLADGTARVDFDRKFAESITGREELRITATPIGGWSALYVERIDADGFVVRSDSGMKDLEFHWVAVGRAEGYERAPEIVIPDRQAEERARRLKEEELQRRSPARRQPVRPAAMSPENR